MSCNLILFCDNNFSCSGPVIPIFVNMDANSSFDCCANCCILPVFSKALRILSIPEARSGVACFIRSYISPASLLVALKGEPIPVVEVGLFCGDAFSTVSITVLISLANPSKNAVILLLLSMLEFSVIVCTLLE